MAALILMYLYYDKNGDIKAVTPTADQGLANEFNTAMFPLSDVEPFLLGQKNPFDFTIKKVKRIGGESFRIIKKETHINVTRTLDNYLTKVSEDTNEIPILKIVADQEAHSIALSLDPAYKELLKNGIDEEQEDVEAFMNHGISMLYFTRRNDPYTLLFTLPFVPKALFDEARVYFPFPTYIDFSYSSVYTRKILSSYGYRVRGVKNVF